MKIKGRTVTPPKSVVVPIPRDDGDIIFQCAPVLDHSEFETICPFPKPPVITKPNEAPKPDPQDREYLRSLDSYSDKKTNWLILKSLSATQDLEWDRVELDKPDTWELFREELAEVFTEREVDLIIEGVFTANMPSEDRQKEALERFMSSQGEAEGNHISQKDELAFTPSGEPANG